MAGRADYGGRMGFGGGGGAGLFDSPWRGLAFSDRQIGVFVLRVVSSWSSGLGGAGPGRRPACHLEKRALRGFQGGRALSHPHENPVSRSLCRPHYISAVHGEVGVSPQLVRAEIRRQLGSGVTSMRSTNSMEGPAVFCVMVRGT